MPEITGTLVKASEARAVVRLDRPERDVEFVDQNGEPRQFRCRGSQLTSWAPTTREDGAQLKIGRCLIDANWGTSTDVVYEFCRQSPHAALLTPSHGRFVGASSRPFSEYRRSPGEKLGLNWFIPNLTGKRAIRHVLFDTNYWKSFVHARLKVAMGDRGCLSLFGDKPEQHRLLAEHLTAEYRIKTSGRGRTVDEWKLRPERADNHWFDCLVGCAVAASMQGVSLTETGAARPRRRPRMSLSEMGRRGNCERERQMATVGTY